MKKQFLLLIVLPSFLSSFGQKETSSKQKIEQMKIEIWSDIVCPWCYIGKRNFEKALSRFEYNDFLIIEYKSYQLDPSMQTDTSVSITEYLSNSKGISISYAQQMIDHVSEVATSVGLDYDLNNAIPINTLQAHGLLHYAKTIGKQRELKERLMKGYFVETLNLDDTNILVQMASDVGLDTSVAREILIMNKFGQQVQQDINEGVQLGLQGVPFFVMNRKFVVSGAQSPSNFLATLNQAFEDWLKHTPVKELEIIDGKVCRADGTCE
ncbi:DsbA family oxidoreductase [Parvicella tangerina]|uniref:DSBA-like thioredoxin domain-containing protein n=1 Tax=Parvicella tangerina TaxID=2829795 RepID=A0A916JJW8_9FLAO|nr:DsbA family oxidoreductase [Parvicella tangerina]CAG5077503.1 hypothetical protein CRYO30217_00407 [Parvicella tangerina]